MGFGLADNIGDTIDPLFFAILYEFKYLLVFLKQQ